MVVDQKERISKILDVIFEVPIETKIYDWIEPNNKYIKKNSIPGLKGNIDFRFLDGDLDDEKIISKTTKKILDGIQDRLKFDKKDVYFLLGVSG
jgi:aminopeptidase-like protein